MNLETTVLVTGANGFLGAAVVLELLARGFRVKGVVTSQEKADAFLRQYPQHGNNLHFCVISDLTDEFAFLEETADVDYIVHTASPFTLDFRDNVKDCLKPAVDRTLTILRVASQRPAIKHVVITSSQAAVSNMNNRLGAGLVYTENTWNPVTWEEAASSPDPRFYVEQHKPHFGITTFCPPWIFGSLMQPIESLETLDKSAAYVWNMISKGESVIPPTVLPLLVDMLTLTVGRAQLHADALVNPKAKNQRYLVAGESAWNEDIVYPFKKAYPEHASRAAKGPYREPAAHYEIDTTKVERDFAIEWTPLKKSVTDMAKVLFEKERELAGRA
ncbi:NADP-binding protein [Dacryopinax primogenitus]|uniref:NADP-binding protein n=1 Tax=Dacryopinax primogenitus (strain DJM 731) TaxID=1858805 RepID=M5GE12_DACPD|nr:NADP-binding protein [Dacryopinax primogenitus]EJU02883.1 NADP-binding protein [Dacryopinax primogenitus]